MIRAKIAFVMKLIDIQLTSLDDYLHLIDELDQDDEFDVENMDAIMATLSQMQTICKDVDNRCSSLWLEVNKEKKALTDVEDKAPF